MVSLADHQTVNISSDLLTAEFKPALGGRMSRLLMTGGTDIIVPLDDDEINLLHWPKAGAYPLFPYHNRIAQAQFWWDEKFVRLKAHPEAMPHSLHGPGHQRRWIVREVTASTVTMQLDYRVDADWPWSFLATQKYALNGTELTVELTLHNKDNKPMPAGIGWHPYFVGNGDVFHDAQYRWLYDADFIPTGKRERLSGDDLKSAPQTQYLQQWKSAAFMLANDLHVKMTAEAIFDHLVIHKAQNYTCLEPVSHVGNAVNLISHGVDDIGIRCLAPEETMRGQLFITILNKQFETGAEGRRGRD